MPTRASKTGSELFIVDNSDDDWVQRYLHDWCQISKGIDVVTGYFEIGPEQIEAIVKPELLTWARQTGGLSREAGVHDSTSSPGTLGNGNVAETSQPSTSCTNSPIRTRGPLAYSSWLNHRRTPSACRP
jgi:hypothetical protein